MFLCFECLGDVYFVKRERPGGGGGGVKSGQANAETIH